MNQEISLSSSKVIDNVQFVKHNSEKSYVEIMANILKTRPFGDCKFYIFSFMKRVDDLAGVKKMYHQPRLTKPMPVPGTTLLRVDPNKPDECTILWTLPDEQDMGLFEEGKIFADEIVHENILKYKRAMRKLAQLNAMKGTKDKISEWEIEKCFDEFLQRCEGDLSEGEIRDFYKGKVRKTP